jgi:hypothetical protein
MRHLRDSRPPLVLDSTRFSRPCWLGRQWDSQPGMWFIVSGLQTVETSVPENCAVEFRSGLSSEQSSSCSFAVCTLCARCTVEISKQYREGSYIQVVGKFFARTPVPGRCAGPNRCLRSASGLTKGEPAAWKNALWSSIVLMVVNGLMPIQRFAILLGDLALLNAVVLVTSRQRIDPGRS